MASYLLDANHASRLLSPDDPLWERVDRATTAGETFLLPLDVIAELQYGVEATRDPLLRARRQEALDRLLTLFHPAHLTPDAALESGRIRGQLRRAGWQLGAIDAHLAAIARLNGFILLTDDGDFEPLAAEIALENWLE